VAERVQKKYGRRTENEVVRLERVKGGHQTECHPRGRAGKADAYRQGWMPDDERVTLRPPEAVRNPPKGSSPRAGLAFYRRTFSYFEF